MPLPVPCCRQSPRAPRFIARRCRQRGPKAAGPRQARGGRTAWSRRGRFAGSCRLPRSAHGLRSEHRPEACLARPHFRALPAHPPASAGPLPARGCGAEGRLGVNFYFKRGKKKFLTPLDTASRWRRWRPYHVTGERGSGDRRGGGIATVPPPLCRYHGDGSSLLAAGTTVRAGCPPSARQQYLVIYGTTAWLIAAEATT